MKEMWEERFSNVEYMYGKNPNQFLQEEIDKLNPGRALFVGEGEGRNAVYAATKGWQVDANDWSENAKRKAEKWAHENNVSIHYKIVDFEHLLIDEEKYDLIVLIFIHVNEELRKKIHSKAITGLKPGGLVILEAYDKDQIKYESGGPKTQDLLYSLEDIYTDFNELEIIKFSKDIVKLDEGILHKGNASVIRYIGQKSDPTNHNT
jgi:cyclopropane fatty-acyl-phospholipid synthase-like methyltransferase